MTQRFVLDAGALVAIERHGHSRVGVLKILVGREAVVPAGVVTEVWRARREQALLAKFLRLNWVTIADFSAEDSYDAGRLLRAVQREHKGRRRPGAVDAMVMQCALSWNAHAIVTGDLDDLEAFGRDIPLLRV
jgi:predicted nucleic acid-binding protein